MSVIRHSLANSIHTYKGTHCLTDSVAKRSQPCQLGNPSGCLVQHSQVLCRGATPAEHELACVGLLRLAMCYLYDWIFLRFISHAIKHKHLWRQWIAPQTRRASLGSYLQCPLLKHCAKQASPRSFKISPCQARIFAFSLFRLVG